MPSIGTYNFPDHISGTTFPGKEFQIVVDSVNLNLTGASINMYLRETPASKEHIEFSTNNGKLIISDAVNGKFQFIEQLVDVFPKQYVYDVRIKLSNNKVFQYIQGNWNIKRPVTNTI